MVLIISNYYTKKKSYFLTFYETIKFDKILNHLNELIYYIIDHLRLLKSVIIYYFIPLQYMKETYKKEIFEY